MSDILYDMYHEYSPRDMKDDRTIIKTIGITTTVRRRRKELSVYFDPEDVSVEWKESKL